MSERGEQTLLAAIRGSGFFADLDEDTLIQLRAAARRVVQPRNTTVFLQGDDCIGFYVVESGAVKIYKESADAKEHVLHVAVEGDFFGEAAMFLGVGYPAAASAIRDSRLILFGKDKFLALLEQDPKLSMKLIAAMAMWAGRLVQSIESLTLSDAATRLAAYMASILPENAPPRTCISLGIPKQTLASHLGMTGETLSRILARFEGEGVIRVEGRRIIVDSPGVLREKTRNGMD